MVGEGEKGKNNRERPQETEVAGSLSLRATWFIQQVLKQPAYTVRHCPKNNQQEQQMPSLHPSLSRTKFAPVSRLISRAWCILSPKDTVSILI